MDPFWRLQQFNSDRATWTQERAEADAWLGTNLKSRHFGDCCLRETRARESILELENELLQRELENLRRELSGNPPNLLDGIDDPLV